MTTTDPSLAHGAHMNKLLEQMDGKKLAVPANMRLPNEPEPAPEQLVTAKDLAPAVPPVAPAPAPVVETPAPQVPAEPIVEQPAAEAQTPAPAPQAAPPRPAQSGLAKRVEIQKRAREAMERARKAASSLRAKPEAPQPPDKNAQERTLLQQEKDRVAALQNRLESEINLAKTDPFGFARRHGMDPARMAQYVREGLDPNKLALDQLRQETANAIQQVRQDYETKLQSVQAQFIAAEDARAQQNFFTFVEEAKETNPEAFAALRSGLVYTDADVWNTANRLLEQDADLRNNFDEDRLLEAVESEARKDPRWPRVQALLKTTNSASQPNAQPQSKSNVSAKEEVSAPTEAAPPRSAPSRDPEGKFAPPQQSRSPFENHQMHVSAMMRRMGLR